MLVVTPPPVHREALQPSQQAASYSSIFKLLLHFAPRLLLPPPARLSCMCSHNIKFRPLPLSHQFDFRCFYLFCGLQAQKGLGGRVKGVLDTHASSLIFSKRRTGQKKSDIDPRQTPPSRRGRRVRPVPSEGRGEGPAAPGERSSRSAPLRVLAETLQALEEAFRHRHRASPAPNRGSPPSPEASRALTRGSPPPLSFSSQPLIPLPPSLPPPSTYPQKANFQLPQSHGRAGSTFSERLRRGPARSSPSPRRPPPARPGYPHTALLLRLRGRAAILGGRRSPRPRPPLAVVPLGG